MPPSPQRLPAPALGLGGWWKCPGPARSQAQATVTLTPTHAQAFTHAHTKWTAPSPADTLGHMHTGAAHSPLHTDTPTPAPAPHPHTCTLTRPHHSAHVSCLLPGKDSARRSGCSRRRGDGAGEAQTRSAPGPQGVPASPCGLAGHPWCGEVGWEKGFGARSSPGPRECPPPPPAGLTDTPGAGGGWSVQLAGSRF